MSRPLILSLTLVIACHRAPPRDARAIAPLSDDDVDERTPKGVVLDEVMTWPRATVRQFGCMLEAAGQKDARFNCTSAKPPLGDPCKDTDAFYAGPEFPAALVPKVGGSIQEIELAWEHGVLQGVTATFAPGVDEAGIRKLVGTAPHENVMSTDVQECATDRLCLVLQGFDHMGAGDVDCE